MNALKKRQVFLAFFLFLSSTIQAVERCKATGELEKAQIKRVVDGDTIHLVDGRKVRLVGIDTPELDHQYGRHDPYAVEATAFLRSLVDQFVYIQEARSDHDRYGRYLYYLFDKNRISLTSQLLSEGLGYRIAVPPNLAYQVCFKGAEMAARNAHKGLWQQTLQWQPKVGFVISRVIITAITKNRGGWWLETNQDLVINLPPSVMNYWPAQKVFYLEGKEIEVRGWQHQRKSRNTEFKSWVLSIRHPNDVSKIHSFIHR